eukprot:TRINITY_DN5137_c0_g2_i1.p1 TRINITY_DN5137_c0_g2~~TRINITY_DN5137_c0_g2_i1.p1  ORF type:complete len:153 (+),score=30.17 TRINITY_DN5137_c0_g2_i1:35-460(+)
MRRVGRGLVGLGGRRTGRWYHTVGVRVPVPQNEPVLTYMKGSKEREAIESEVKRMKAAEPVEIPIIIGGEEYKTGKLEEVRAPHNHKQVLARYHCAGERETKLAIEASQEAKQKYSENKGLISEDRRNKPTLPLTIPHSCN